MQPQTTNGYLFQALGRNDIEKIKYWQARLNEDEGAQDEFGVMARYALEELVTSIGAKAFGSFAVARLHKQLVTQGFQFTRLEVLRVLEAAIRRGDEDRRVEDAQAIKIRIGLFRLIASVHGVLDDKLDEIVVRAEDRLHESLSQ